MIMMGDLRLMCIVDALFQVEGFYGTNKTLQLVKDVHGQKW